MKRQYLNVLYSPTTAYKGYTEGLCGFMDNNATNDFAGPDGTVYKDAVQFAESCKIACSKLFFIDRFRSVCESRIKFQVKLFRHLLLYRVYVFSWFAVFDWLIDTHVYFDKICRCCCCTVLKRFICKNSLDVKQINHVLGFKMIFFFNN